MTREHIKASLETYRPYLLRLARRYDPADADDLLGDVIVRALSTAAIPKGDAFLPWIRAIMRRMHYDRRRKAKRVPPPIGLLDETEETAPAEPCAGGDVIRRAMTIAGPEVSGWFSLIADGYRPSDIAATRGCSSQAVRNRLLKARNRIRREIGGDCQ